MNICFVSEHGPTIGDGHISRQYAIAEWLIKNKITTDLYTNNLNNLFVDKFQEISAGVFETESALIANHLISAAEYQWCFIDGDQISNAVELAIKKSTGCRTIRVSDLPVHYQHSDVLINQNFGSDQLEYEDVSGQKRFLGLKHVMLREMVREFEPTLPNDQNKKITISLGNSIGENSRALLKALMEFFSGSSFDDFDVEVFTNNHIEHRVSPRRRKGIRIRTPSNEFIASVKGSEFVVCSVGTTMWECMALGIPFIVIPLNDSQAAYVETLKSAKICMSVAPDALLQRSNELSKATDHCLDKNAQTNYRSLFKKIMPDRYFAALEEILDLSSLTQFIDN
jgi:spore coat polysaccharide biosynthesis predicted glycosyltransferase SpsG